MERRKIGVDVRERGVERERSPEAFLRCVVIMERQEKGPPVGKQRRIRRIERKGLVDEAAKEKS